jgi:hypothetical protein
MVRIRSKQKQVRWILAPRQRTDLKALGTLGGHVLVAVHRDVHLIAEQSGLDFSGKEAFVIELGQGQVAKFVPLGTDEYVVGFHSLAIALL